MNKIEKENIKKKNKKYTIDFKLEVIDMINKGVSLHAIEEKLKLDRSMMRKQKNEEEKLRLVKNKDKKYRTNRGGEIKRTMTESQGK